MKSHALVKLTRNAHVVGDQGPFRSKLIAIEQMDPELITFESPPCHKYF